MSENKILTADEAAASFMRAAYDAVDAEWPGLPVRERERRAVEVLVFGLGGLSCSDMRPDAAPGNGKKRGK